MIRCRDRGSEMTDEPSSVERGAAMPRTVCAGDVVEVPEGSLPFNVVMQRTLFAEVWTRDVLDLDRGSAAGRSGCTTKRSSEGSCPYRPTTYPANMEGVFHICALSR